MAQFTTIAHCVAVTREPLFVMKVGYAACGQPTRVPALRCPQLSAVLFCAHTGTRVARVHVLDRLRHGNTPIGCEVRHVSMLAVVAVGNASPRTRGCPYRAFPYILCWAGTTVDHRQGSCGRWQVYTTTAQGAWARARAGPAHLR